MSFIGRSWRGKEKLWKVFWLYGFLFSFALKIVLVLVGKVVPLVVFPLAIFSVAYLIWWVVAVWRSAFNVDIKFFGYLARAYVLVAPLLVVLGLMVGGVLVGQDLIKAAECRKAKTTYETAVAAGGDTRQQQQDMLQKCPQLVPTQPAIQQPAMPLQAAPLAVPQPVTPPTQPVPVQPIVGGK